MAFSNEKIRAIVFDYGNTLIEFGPAQIGAGDRGIADAVERLFGPVDRERLRAIRDANRMALFKGDPPQYRENDLDVITSEMVRELYGVMPTRPQLDEILQARMGVFVESTWASDDVKALLGRLGQRYRLGLLSNYPSGDAIRVSLDKVGLSEFFEAVVVSADLGYVKPHPITFQTIMTAMDARPDEILFVGDNWLADIQGAKRAGMYAVLTTEWVPYEHFDRHPNDHQPDLTISRLNQLESHL